MKKFVAAVKKVNMFFNNMADVPVEIAMAHRNDIDHVQIDQVRQMKQHRDFVSTK